MGFTTFWAPCWFRGGVRKETTHRAIARRHADHSRGPRAPARGGKPGARRGSGLIEPLNTVVVPREQDGTRDNMQCTMAYGHFTVRNVQGIDRAFAGNAGLYSAMSPPSMWMQSFWCFRQFYSAQVMCFQSPWMLLLQGLLPHCSVCFVCLLVFFLIFPGWFRRLGCFFVSAFPLLNNWA